MNVDSVLISEKEARFLGLMRNLLTWWEQTYSFSCIKKWAAGL